LYNCPKPALFRFQMLLCSFPVMAVKAPGYVAVYKTADTCSPL